MSPGSIRRLDKLRQPDFEAKRGRDAMNAALRSAGVSPGSSDAVRMGMTRSVLYQLEQAGYALLPLFSLEAAVRLPESTREARVCGVCAGGGSIYAGGPGHKAHVCSRCDGAGVVYLPSTRAGNVVRRCIVKGCEEPHIATEDRNDEAEYAHLGCLLAGSADFGRDAQARYDAELEAEEGES